MLQEAELVLLHVRHFSWKQIWPEVRIYTDSWAVTNSMDYLGFAWTKVKRLVKSKIMKWVVSMSQSPKIVPELGNVCASSKCSAEGPQWRTDSLTIR